MKVEFLTRFKHDGQTYEAGDTKTVDEDFGAYVCGVGWAKDLAGQVKSGDRNISKSVELSVDNVKSKTTARQK